jgi:hypothetical protein
LALVVRRIPTEQTQFFQPSLQQVVVKETLTALALAVVLVVVLELKAVVAFSAVVLELLIRVLMVALLLAQELVQVVVVQVKKALASQATAWEEMAVMVSLPQ